MEYWSAKLRHAQQLKGQGEIQEASELITGTTGLPWELMAADPASFRCKGVFVHGSGFSSLC